MIGTGLARENNAVATCSAKAVAARGHAPAERRSKARSRFKSVEPAIQKGITRPNRAASVERTPMCTSNEWRESAGCAKAATFSSLPHIRPSTTTAKIRSVIKASRTRYGCLCRAAGFFFTLPASCRGPRAPSASRLPSRGFDSPRALRSDYRAPRQGAAG
jgi:hypothetical protein